tara:strand:+ start:553 stop:1005 length:453 start_codon:yes stop_codon:yes gene_type:complete
MKRHTALTSTYANELDSDGTLTAQSPSGAHRDPLRRVGRGVLVAIGISLCFMPIAGGSIPKQYISYKEYAYYALGYNLKEYKCLSILYGKESAWNPRAVNGSHYGIPQGKSEWLKDQDGYTQIQWGLDYIGHRYGEPCIALAHWRAKGWH